MDETKLHEAIGELLAETRKAPAETPPAEPIPHTDESPDAGGLQRRMNVIQEGLDHLRLAIKYLVFDLEATKRENRILRKMID